MDQAVKATIGHLLMCIYTGCITSAVIQDICFSRFSQWVAIVTSNGTGHKFILFPFGGECGMQVQNYHADRPILAPQPSFPWWFASSFAKNQYPFLYLPLLLLLYLCKQNKNRYFWMA